MSPPRRLFLIIGVVFLLLLAGLGAGVYYYLFGANAIDSADLVPADTLVFASIPNAATLVEGYETSQAKTLLESPNVKPLLDNLSHWLGPKNFDLLLTFLPNLSGQSFLAVTRFDYDHPEQAGLIAAMKPKAGLGDFGTFLDKLKAAYPDLIKQGKTGTGTVEGVNYEWIQGPGAPDKICVAQVYGWIVTAWGEASLQDWIERYRKKSTTTSLAHDLDYEKSMARVGDNPMTVLYLNYHSMLGILQKQLAKTNPVAGDYLAKKLQAVGGEAVATKFENGEIVDRVSLLFPRPAQTDSGMGVDPCPFDTLKFTGPDTRFYWASSINWKQYYKNIRERSHDPEVTNPLTDNTIDFLSNWARSAGLDTPHNIVNPLGSELSVQAEWNADAPYPEVGVFVKLDQPDDFKPTITAIINTVRQAFSTTGVIKELSVGGQNFAALEFVQTSPISPTITEGGPYLGVFLTENQAVRSFQRDPSLGLTHNANFNRQVGDRRNGAAQLVFLDTPYLLDRAYRTALPYLSMAEMFNKSLAAMLNGKDLPPDLNWLTPIGTWSCVITPDEEGIQAYSVSGIGNQGIFLAGAGGGTVEILQSMGILPKGAGMPGTTYVPGTPPVPSPLLPWRGAPSTGLSQTDLDLASKMKAAPFPPTPGLPPLPPPTNSGAGSAPAATIYLTMDNKIFFDETPVPQDQFADFLKAKKAANESLRLAVKVDKDASPDVLSTVMDAGASAGFGVLPYAYTSGAASLPPAANSHPAPTSPDASTNALATPPGPAASTNNPTTTTPANSTPDGTPAPPSPSQ